MRILLALLAGTVIGSERSRHNNPAGLRTHILVCLGSALVMTTAQYLMWQFQASDLSRMGAQVISGIGFLGAGTIILSGGRVKGLTTAAGLWATACLGLAIGIGFYEGAILGGLAVVAALALLRNFSHKLILRSPYVSLCVFVKTLDDFARLNAYLKQSGATVETYEFMTKEPIAGTIAVDLELALPKTMTKAALIENINNMGGITILETA